MADEAAESRCSPPRMAAGSAPAPAAPSPRSGPVPRPASIRSFPRSSGVKSAARANEFAATTTRNPPSRIGGPAVRASAVHAQATRHPSGSAVTVRTCVPGTGDYGSYSRRDDSSLENRKIRLRGLWPPAWTAMTGHEHADSRFLSRAPDSEHRQVQRGAPSK